MIWTVIKSVCLALLLLFFYKVARAYKIQRDLEKQGVIFMSKIAYIGDVIKLISTATKYPHDLFANKMVEQAFGDKVPSKVGIYLFGIPMVLFTKCGVLDDFYVKHKEFFTKHGMQRSGN